VDAAVHEIREWGKSRWAAAVMPLVTNDIPVDHPSLDPIWRAADEHDLPIVHHSQYDLTWRTCEQRACQRADLALGSGQVLHVYNVHLGTAVLERRYQAGRLAAFVHDRRVTGPKVILGDFNEWMRGLATKTLSSLFESIDIAAHLKRRRTYPGLFPVVHLDHIYYEGRLEVVSVEMPRTRKALMASDHLPLVANLRVG